MAPAASKSRDNQFFNVGVQGRKTGITLEDTGVRDEHGMEPIDGIFSSPEKSPEKSPPRRTNARPQADHTLTSSDMDVQRSSMPEPADALSARKSIRPGKSSIFPPPMGRSPIKTSLGSSPRRQSSMGPPSGLRRTSEGPDRSGAHTAVRRLDFGAVDDDNVRAPGSGSRNRGPPRPDIFDLPTSPGRNKKRTHEESFVDDETVLEESELAINGIGDDSPLPDVEDTLPILDQGGDTEPDEPDEPDEPIEESMEIPEEPQPRPSLTKGRGKARKSLEHKESPPPAPSPPPKKKPGRPKKTQGLVSARASNAAVPARSRTTVQSRPSPDRHVEDESAMDVDQSIEEASMPQVGEEEIEELEEKIEEGEETEPDSESEQEPEPEPELEPELEPEAPPAKKKKRGRPPKSSSKPDAHVDEPEEPVQLPERPAKKAKKGPASKKPPPSQRNPNARITAKKDSAKNKSKGKQKEDMPPPPLPPASQTSSQPDSSQSRGLQILRQGTPFEDEGARTTRSGRISTKPVDYWRNERIEYGHDGTKKEIIRAEDVEATKRSAARAKPRKRTSKRAESAIEEEPELELEEWEINEGQFQGWVNGWDEQQNAIIDEGGRHEELAYSAVKLQTREVAGANFRYSKILGTPFFGAGMVDIPPHGSKRSKNSRRMYMAFCLLSGKVGVTVGDNEFSISTGGVFMVPRGNFYSITNENEVPARIFFAQGCEVAPGQTTPGS